MSGKGSPRPLRNLSETEILERIKSDIDSVRRCFKNSQRYNHELFLIYEEIQQEIKNREIDRIHEEIYGPLPRDFYLSADKDLQYGTIRCGHFHSIELAERYAKDIDKWPKIYIAKDGEIVGEVDTKFDS